MLPRQGDTMDRNNLIEGLADAFNEHERQAKEKEEKVIKERCEQVQHAIDMGFMTEADVYKRLHDERNKMSATNRLENDWGSRKTAL